MKKDLRMKRIQNKNFLIRLNSGKKVDYAISFYLASYALYVQSDFEINILFFRYSILRDSL